MIGNAKTLPRVKHPEDVDIAVEEPGHWNGTSGRFCQHQSGREACKPEHASREAAKHQLLGLNSPESREAEGTFVGVDHAVDKNGRALSKT